MATNTGYKSDASQTCDNPGVVPESVPTDIKNMVPEILQMYASKDSKEQATIVQKYYSVTPPAHFVDPLMDVTGQQEITEAFYSLQKLFKEVKMQEKGISLNPKPRLPKELDAAAVKQYVVDNQQLYTFERANVFARCLLPQEVDLSVKSYLTTDPQSGKILWHEDVWENKGFGFPWFLKRPNGVLSHAMFKLVGWSSAVKQAQSTSH